MENTHEQNLALLQSLNPEVIQELVELIEPEDMNITLPDAITKEEIEINRTDLPDYAQRDHYTDRYREFVGEGKDITSPKDVGAFLGSQTQLKASSMVNLYQAFKAYAKQTGHEIAEKPKWLTITN